LEKKEMQTGVMRLSDLVRENRMDAGFHLAAQKHAAAVEGLRAVMSEDEAREIALGLPDSVITRKVDGTAVLEPLTRGSMPRTSLKELRRTIAEYPHLSLVMLSQHLDEAMAEARTHITRIEGSIASMRKVTDLAGKASS
jgi:hypothetical protein